MMYWYYSKSVLVEVDVAVAFAFFVHCSVCSGFRRGLYDSKEYQGKHILGDVPLVHLGAEKPFPFYPSNGRGGQEG